MKFEDVFKIETFDSNICYRGYGECKFRKTEKFKECEYYNISNKRIDDNEFKQCYHEYGKIYFVSYYRKLYGYEFFNIMLITNSCIIWRDDDCFKNSLTNIFYDIYLREVLFS